MYLAEVVVKTVFGFVFDAFHFAMATEPDDEFLESEILSLVTALDAVEVTIRVYNLAATDNNMIEVTEHVYTKEGEPNGKAYD